VVVRKGGLETINALRITVGSQEPIRKIVIGRLLVGEVKNLTEETNFFFILDLNMEEEDSSMWVESVDNVQTKLRKSRKLLSPQM
jgi:hypothetical protein